MWPIKRSFSGNFYVNSYFKQLIINQKRNTVIALFLVKLVYDLFFNTVHLKLWYHNLILPRVFPLWQFYDSQKDTCRPGQGIHYLLGNGIVINYLDIQ